MYIVVGFQRESLKSFTIQLLARSNKSVFAILTGIIVLNKNYKLFEYLCSFFDCIGFFLNYRYKK